MHEAGHHSPKKGGNHDKLQSLGRIQGHLADSIFSYSLSGRCSSRAVSGGRALSAEPPTQLLLRLLVLLVPLLAKSRPGCFSGDEPGGGVITGRVMCVTCARQLSQFYLQKSPYSYFRSSLSIATPFSRFALPFSTMEQFPCDSGADFCTVSLLHTLSWPRLACTPGQSVGKMPPHHLMLFLCGLGLCCLTPLARSRLSTMTLVSQSKWLLFFADSEKRLENCRNLGKRTADALSADNGGSRCSAQCFSLVTFGENGLTFFFPLTFSTVLPGLEEAIHEIPNFFLPWAREKQEGLNAAVIVLSHPILFHLVSPQSTWYVVVGVREQRRITQRCAKE